LAKAIKEKFPSIKLFAGGPHITESSKAYFLESSFDVGIIGEGEHTVRELCDGFVNEAIDYSKIDGIMYRKGDPAQVVLTRPRAFEEDLDVFPFPARDLLPPLKLYRPSALYYQRLPVTQMLTSRGCPAQCIFCDTPFGKIVRYHSPEYVIEEMLMLKKDFGIREILINDDTFVIRKDRVYEICRLMRKHHLDIVWSCNVRVNAVDFDILKEMVASGCWLIMPGAESGSQKVLDTLKKGITLEQVQQACQWAHRLGLRVKPSFIIGNPGDTVETIDETIRFAASLKTHYPSFTLFTPYPGTRAYEMALDYGTLSEDVNNFALSSLEPSFVPNGLTADILKKKQSEGFRKIYLNPGMVWRHLSSIRDIEEVSKMVRSAMMLLKM
jgi:radical SAM superfamily enzyme YgiQ (UPF0313 family)